MAVSDAVPYVEGSAVLLVDRQGRVLLQQRDDDVPPAGVGRWAVPGGGRIGDETPLHTAVREFEEGTGVRLAALRHFASYDPSTDPWMQRFQLHLFIAQDDVPSEEITVFEGADFSYWNPEEALKLPVNPTTAHYLRDTLDSPLYAAACDRIATGRRWVSVLEIDRWGRVLALSPADAGRPGAWSLPGGPIDDRESPDRAALRHFAAHTGHTLDTLKLFRAYRREPRLFTAPAPRTHVYYLDADLHPHDLDLAPDVEATYLAHADLDTTPLADYARTILADFFESPAYKAMFH